jgi:hypothetical protein
MRWSQENQSNRRWDNASKRLDLWMKGEQTKKYGSWTKQGNQFFHAG